LNTANLYRDLLWQQPHDVQARLAALTELGFADVKTADQNLRGLAVEPAFREAGYDFVPGFLNVLAQSASPDRALVSFRRLVDSLADPASLLYGLTQEPHALHLLVTLLAGSQFLTEILLRSPEYLPALLRPEALARHKTRPLLQDEARAAMAPSLDGTDDQAPNYAAAFDALRHFQHRELLRIGTCDLNGLLDLSSVTVQLSHLADGMVQVCLDTLACQFGVDPASFAVIAMGKLGGGELNYSSDIDLLFIARADATAYERLGKRLIQALTNVTAEGFLYRVDMRLRPWGAVGPLVTTIEGHLAYLEKHARLWEKQALLKARVMAGAQSVGQEFLQAATPLLFQSDAGQVRADVHAMKQRTEAHLRQQGRNWGEVKLGEGSIRDVEFVVQYLQLIHGGAHPEVRGGNTLQVMMRLVSLGLLPADEQRVLADGYLFLRTVEHYLQILDYRQTYTLPGTAPELAYLAQRLGFQGQNSTERFVLRYQGHSTAVRAVYLRHLGGTTMTLPAGTSPDSPHTAVDRHLARMSSSYATSFDAAEIRRHAELAAQLDDETPAQVEAVPLADGRWRVTIVAYDYLGELSLICGLLFVYAFSIIDGHVYTYDTEGNAPAEQGRGPTGPAAPGRVRPDTRRKIVDVFTVRPVRDEPETDVWSRYAADLARLARRLQAREQREVQGELAKRVATVLHDMVGATPAVYPLDIGIDNETSDRYTVLHIEALDTIGFLYEFTNALALNGVYIAQVTVTSFRNRVRDTLYVTDSQGRKISAPEKLHELRAATALVKHFTHLLPSSSNPELALVHFHEYLGELFRRPSWPDDLGSLQRPEVLDALARLLGVSDFLWDDFLRMQYANLFPVLRDPEQLAVAKPRAQLEAELANALAISGAPEAWRDALNAFKDREMFRIDMRLIQHNTDLSEFQAELSDLAEIVLAGAATRCDRDLRFAYGEPRRADGRPAALSVCALGKCGGRELGFASDIELMFIFAGNGQTTGPQVISTAEYYERLVVEFTRSIRARREGIFEIDLRLRPYGNAGSLAVPLDSFARYFGPGGPAWSYERQALIKLRPIAGDTELAAQILAQRDRCVYESGPFDLAGMKAMRERQLRHLVTPGGFNAKFSRGGLVDLEYLVQGLQITYGQANPSLRLTNTRQAIYALGEAGVLSEGDYACLSAAYQFLRQLIDALRMVRGNAKDLAVPAADSEEFAFLARRMAYNRDLERLVADISLHTNCVQEISGRLLG
jgi:[glutamine synthetase] adenylyltransferase / [glutamine synthetase]-adenylyl-L-tyrosine phosphorylase